jgi:hypothetical protein
MRYLPCLLVALWIPAGVVHASDQPKLSRTIRFQLSGQYRTLDGLGSLQFPACFAGERNDGDRIAVEGQRS